MSYELEDFFPKEDPEMARYERHVELFGTDNDFLLIAIDHGKSVFNLRFLQELDSLTKALADLTDVRNATSATNYSEPVFAPLGMLQVPVVNLQEARFQRDSAKIFHEGTLVNVLFSQNAQAVTLVVECEERLSKRRSDELLSSIEQTCARTEMGQVFLSGRIHGQYHYIQKMQDEFRFFLLISFVLLLLVLSLIYRNVWAVLLPLLIVALTVVWTLALVVLMGRTLSIMTVALPTILFVVGTSDVVHILERYREELGKGLDKIDALLNSLREVGLATVLTSLTTAIGFLSLLVSSIAPIREFGVITAAGVLIAYLLAFTVLPPVWVLLPAPKQFSKPKHSGLWAKLLGRSFLFSLRRRKLIGIVAAMLVLLAAFGIQQIKVNNYLLEDWPDDDPQKQEFFYFEDNFSGVRPFELQVELKNDQTLFDLELLQKLELLETHLTEEYGVRGVSSILSLLRGTNKALLAGSSSAYRLPESEAEMARTNEKLLSAYGESWYKQYVQESVLRFSGKTLDEGGYIHKQKNQALDAFIQAHFNPQSIGVHQTGMAYLIDRNNETLSKELLQGLLLAFVSISLIMALLFRSWRMVLVALVPNTVPLLLIGGVMGFLGIDLKVSTAVIFTIAFGIAVDDTIHFLAKLKLELAKGNSMLYALKRTFYSAGKAIAVTTIVLGSGFFALVVSDLNGTYYLGLLVSLTLIFALLADLLLIPALLLLFRKR